LTGGVHRLHGHPGHPTTGPLKKSPTKITALVLFVQNCQPELVQMCLEFGANPSKVSEHDLAECKPETKKERIQKMLSSNITKLDTSKAACPWG